MRSVWGLLGSVGVFNVTNMLFTSVFALANKHKATSLFIG